ncbi:helix-turn-helix domain-containing protein [Hymenobacter terrenus]|uniref:helix-turn-helix domain-containing protein n=1 Tax=Hymenobacter terrenus TaxID=1629124 RepID=UPI0006199512|nr:helix-turn-helix domain-containing protein [Hymenobacter terrenus]
MPAFAPRPRHGLTETVRAHFGLSQQALARLLGCHQATVARDEAGQLPLRGGAAARLDALAALVPEAPEPAPPPVPDPGPLRTRLAACRHALAALARPVPPGRQRAAAQPAAAARRLAAAAAVPASLAAAAVRYPLPPGRAALQAGQWALLLSEARLAPSGPAAAAAVLRDARHAGLLAEVAVLEAALETAGSG